MFNYRIIHMKPLFQMSQTNAIIIQLPHTPARRTCAQIHFAVLSIKSTNTFIPLPFSLPVL